MDIYSSVLTSIADSHVIASAITPKEILDIAKRLGKDEENVSLLKVPKEEELTCVL